MTNNKKLTILISAMVAMIAAIVLLLLPEPEKAAPSVAEAKSDKVTVRIKAVGDNLIHSPIYNSCKTEDGFNFDAIYENITPYIEDADISAINQETIFVESVSALSGYPAFGSPIEVGESVAKAGFNLITHATNHTLDKGTDAIEYSMDFWDKYENITVLGVNRSEEEKNTVEVWEKDGLKIAMLNFTYGLNGHVLPSGKEYLVNVFEQSDDTAELIQKAEECADITLVFIHFGTEYTHTPTDSQISDIDFLCSNGADVIIGTHPHVVQPVTKHISENGNEAIVFYSLGNFLSNQDTTSKILGAMADITITKENGVTKVESYAMYPTVTHRSDGKFSVYMLDDYTEELAGKHTRVRGLTLDELKNLYNEIISIEVY